jgi:hypothetical protein
MGKRKRRKNQPPAEWVALAIRAALILIDWLVNRCFR